MQREFRRAGIIRRHYLRPREVGFEELVRGQQSAVFILIEEMMTAGKPEVAPAAHCRARSTSSGRPLWSIGAGSSSMSSIKLNTGLFPEGFACNVRKDSRIVSFS